MAATSKKLVDLLKPSVKEVQIKDKYLRVETISDGYTGTVNGTYVYKVEEKGGDYKVGKFLTGKDGKQYVNENSIIMTDGDIIFFTTHTTKYPYEFPIVNQEKIESYDVKEKQVLQAFIAFVEDEFKSGVYNVFIEDEPDLYGEDAPATEPPKDPEPGK